MGTGRGLTGRVCGIGYFLERDQAANTSDAHAGHVSYLHCVVFGQGYGGLQSTQCKNPHKNYLLSPGQVQPRQGRDRNRQNRQVSGDMHPCIRVPEILLGQTMSGDSGVPESGDGDAVEERA